MINPIIIDAQTLCQSPNPDTRYSIEKMRRLYEQPWFDQKHLYYMCGNLEKNPSLCDLIHAYYKSDANSLESDEALETLRIVSMLVL